MSRTLTTADSVTDDLDRTRRYATTTILTGLFIGGAIALMGGGSLAQQLAVTGLVATIVSVGSCWVLRRLAGAVTGGTDSDRIAHPTHKRAMAIEREHNSDDRSGDSAAVDAR